MTTEVKDFVDGLHDITKSLYSVVHQKNAIRHAILRINDKDTLDLLTEACEVDHPAISDAASEKSEILSLTSQHAWEIDQSTSEVVGRPDAAIAAVETLTITELKYRLLAYTHAQVSDSATTGEDDDIKQRLLTLSKESHNDTVSMRTISLLTLMTIGVNAPEDSRAAAT